MPHVLHYVKQNKHSISQQGTGAEEPQAHRKAYSASLACSCRKKKTRKPCGIDSEVLIQT